MEKLKDKFKSKLVWVSKGEDSYKNTLKVLSYLELPDLKEKKILIKPNCGKIYLPEAGVTTHPAVVSAIIEHLRKKGVKDIFIGESPISGVKVMETFAVCRIAKVSKERDVPLIDLDLTLTIILPIPQGILINQVKLSHMVKEFDYIITVPVMKCHMHTQVTLGLRNMKGILRRREKVKFHQIQALEEKTKGNKELDIAISDFLTAIMPDLSIIDGTFGMEGMGPSSGNPKNSQLIVGSSNPIAGDIVSSYLMGFEPEEVNHLRLIAQRYKEPVDIYGYEIYPEHFKKHRTRFEPPLDKISFNYSDVKVHEGDACSACLSTLLLFLKRYHNKLRPCYLSYNKIHLCIGKGVQECPNGTIYVGKCAMENEGEGIVVEGCPPVPSQIIEEL